MAYLVLALLPGLWLAGGRALAGQALSMTHRDTPFAVFRLEAGEEPRLRFFWKRPDGRPYGGLAALAQDLAARGETLVFAINGGIYARNLTPLGLYVEQGKTLSELNTGRGGGNFFLRPNGVFFFDEQGARVVKTEEYRPRGTVRQAVQSGPMLVIDGRLHPRFLPGYHSRHLRSGVGLDRAGRVVFALSEAPVNFHDFGTLFRDRLDCPNALYLDGKIVQLYLPELGHRALWAWRPLVSLIALTAERMP